MYLYSSIPCIINSFPGFHNPHLAFAVYGCHASCRSAIYYATSDWLTMIRTGRSLLFVRKRSFHGLTLNIPRSCSFCYNAAPNPYRSIKRQSVGVVEDLSHFGRWAGKSLEAVISVSELSGID
jgi:hypothetical protein